MRISARGVTILEEQANKFQDGLLPANVVTVYANAQPFVLNPGRYFGQQIFYLTFGICFIIWKDIARTF